ncbi:MAG: hypothetical protein JKY32_07140 [Rhizobiales bacterium]|nr:hypothetical protein [Hyphomicrobiales bacterium]
MILWKLIGPYVMGAGALLAVLGAFALRIRSNTLKSVRAKQNEEHIKARSRIDAEKIDTDVDAARERLRKRGE